MMLITATLLNGFRYYVNYDPRELEDHEEKEEMQREDFLRMLRREPFEMPGESIFQGRQLEQNVMEYTADPSGEWPRYISEIGNRCMGGVWQQAVKRELDGFLYYGRMDHMNRGIISDLKWCASYDVGKFVKSAQHRIYLFAVNDEATPREKQVNRFNYEISDGRSNWVESYFNHPGIADELRVMTAEFMSYLRDDPEAQAIYNEKWKALS